MDYNKTVGDYRLNEEITIESCEIFVGATLIEVHKWLKNNPGYVYVECYRDEHVATNEQSYKDYLKRKNG